MAESNLIPGDFDRPNEVTYVLLVAQHGTAAERLLVRDSDGRHYLWFGDAERGGLDMIPAGLARWISGHGDLRALGTDVWVHVDDLPLAPTPTGGRR